MRTVVQASINLRVPLLFVVLIASVVAAFQLPRIDLRLDGNSLIPKLPPNTVQAESLLKRFGKRDVIAVCISSHNAMLSREGLTQIQNVARALEELEFVTGRVHSLLSTPLVTTNRHVVEMLDYSASDLAFDEATVARIKSNVLQLGLDDGVLISQDGRAVAIYAEVAPRASRRDIAAQIHALTSQLSTAQFHVVATGNAVAQSLLGVVTANDLMKLVPLVLTVIGVALACALRSLMVTCAIFFELGATLLLTGGLLAASGQPVFITTLILPILLLVIGVNDDIYAVGNFRRLALAKKETTTESLVVTAFSEIAKPICLTSATTFVGLITLVTTDLSPQRVFGLFGAISIAISTLFTFTILPAMLVLIDYHPRHDFRVGQPSSLQAFVGALKQKWQPPKWMRLFICLLIGLSLIGCSLLKVDDSWMQNLPQDSDVVVGSHVFDEKMAGATILDILLDSGKEGGVCEASWVIKMRDLEAQLRALPEAEVVRGGFSELLRVQAATENSSFQTLLATASDRSLSNLIDSEQNAMLILTQPKSFVTSVFDDDLRYVHLTVFVRKASVQRIGHIWKELEKHSQHLTVLPAGDTWISYLSVRLLVEGQLRSMAISLLLEALLLTAAYHSLHFALIALVPVTLSCLFVLGGMGWAGYSIGIANSMFVAVAIGIGIDYSVHYLSKLSSDKVMGSPNQVTSAIKEVSWPIIVGGLSVAAGTSILLLSNVRPNRELGGMIAVSVLLAAGLTLTVIPASQKLLFPRKS
jgi:predicted RND superfamily exporter protein